MKGFRIARALVLLFLFSPAPSVGADCEPTADFDGFRAWISEIGTSDCARDVIARYPRLDAGRDGATVVAAVNDYHAIFREFFDILERAEFDSPIRDSILAEDNARALAIDEPVSEFKPLLISLPVPVPREDGFSGRIEIGEIAVGNYRQYLELCVEQVDQPRCDAWVATLRLIATVDYLSADFRQVLNSRVLDDFERPLKRYINLWDDYYTRRKPQMPWEMAINQVANRDVRTAGYFATPPDGDWIVMHPSLVYSSVSGADDGDEKDFALAIEVVGYNWWDNDYLSGVSLVGVTSDRKGIKDEGYGLMLHFGSRYSLGWSRHDDEDGWFVSMDLLGAAIDKERELDQWEQDFRRSIGALKQ